MTGSDSRVLRALSAQQRTAHARKREPFGGGSSSPANATPCGFACRTCGGSKPYIRQRAAGQGRDLTITRKETIFAPGWQAILRENGPRPGKAGPADRTEGACGPLQIPRKNILYLVIVILA